MSLDPRNTSRVYLQIWLLVLFLCLQCVPHSSAVLGIDFGSELIKVAAVAPGRTFEIVLDEASKRSHPNLVLFDDDIRQYGTSASSLVQRRPLRSFLQFSRLLGKPANTSMVDVLATSFIFNEVAEADKRNTVRFVSPYYDPSQATVEVDPEEEPSPENAANILNIIASEPSISVEELTTMKLKHIKRMAENEMETAEVKDCVIVVPEFWSFKERQALLDCAQMAGLNVLGLINENTAAALQYAITREYEQNKTETVIFYNMGATSTKVNVVRYYADTSKKSKSKTTNEGIGAFQVLSQSWDETLGASNFDIAIANIVMERAFDMLASKQAVVGKDFSDAGVRAQMRLDARFTARIRIAATRAKKILSANLETLVSIEGIYDDLDFKTKVTRDELYAECASLFGRASTVLHAAVADSGVDKTDIASVVLVGGGTRIPAIREMLTDFLEKPVKEDLNADEGPAFGAAFRAANLSSTFRLRWTGMEDVTPFAVGVRLKDLRPDTDGEAFKKRGSLFDANNFLFRRRAVTLKHDKDLRVELFYEKTAPLPMDTSRDLGAYEITGVPKAIEKYMQDEKYNITELPKLSLSFLLDANGVVDLVSATASFTEWVTEEKEVKKKTSTKKTQKSKDSETDTKSESETETETDTETDASASDADADGDKDADKDSEKDAEKDNPEVELVSRKRTHRVDLNAVRFGPDDVKAMQQSDFAHSAKILLELDDRDRSVQETAQGRNDLESYIFESRNRISDETNVQKVTTEDERDAFVELLNSAEDWIWEIEKESAGVYKSKLRELKQGGNAMFQRAGELEARPAAIAAVGKTLSQLYESVEMLRTNYTWVNATDIDKLENATNKAETWLNSKIEEQDEKSLLEKPAFFSYDIYYKVEPAVEMARRLLSRQKPYGWGKKKKVKNGTNTTTEESAQTDKEGSKDEAYTSKIEVDDDADADAKEDQENDGDGDGDGDADAEANDKTDL